MEIFEKFSTRPHPYQYNDLEIDDYKEHALFNERKELVSIYGLKVDSKITFTAPILKAFKEYPFPQDFLDLYGSATFTISDFQTDLVYTLLDEENKCVSFDVPSQEHRRLFLEFSKENAKLLPDYGFGDSNCFFCFDVRCYVQAKNFPTFFSSQSLNPM